MTITLLQGDCLELMRTLPAGSVDAVVTDPPYGIRHKTGWSKYLYGRVKEQYGDGTIRGDNDTSLRDWVIEWANGKPCAVFGTWKRKKPAGTRAVLIWDKGASTGMGDLSFPWKPSWEEIYIIGKGWRGFRDEGVLKGHFVPARLIMERYHPNEKPVSLIKHLIEKLPKNFTVLDPFMGSGTTGVACVQTGRNFIGMEIDPTYFAIAEKRIRDAQQQMALPMEV